MKEIKMVFSNLSSNECEQMLNTILKESFIMGSQVEVDYTDMSVKGIEEQGFYIAIAKEKDSSNVWICAGSGFYVFYRASEYQTKHNYALHLLFTKDKECMDSFSTLLRRLAALDITKSIGHFDKITSSEFYSDKYWYRKFWHNDKLEYSICGEFKDGNDDAYLYFVTPDCTDDVRLLVFDNIDALLDRVLIDDYGQGFTHCINVKWSEISHMF